VVSDQLQVSFVPVTLRDLDSSAGQMVIVTLFDEERPPRGLSGLVDWRLDGLVSRIRMVTLDPKWSTPHHGGSVLRPFPAAFGEKLLIPVGKKMRFEWAMVVGLGQTSEFTLARYRSAIELMLEGVGQMQCSTISMQLPGWEAAGIPARRAIETLLYEWKNRRDNGKPAPGSITVFEPLAAQREMHERVVEMLEHEFRQR